MRSRIIVKFGVLYILIGLAGFLLISSVGARMVENRLVSMISRNMYREASRIAADRDLLSAGSAEDLDLIYRRLSAIAAYRGSEIWLMGQGGEIYLNTARAEGDYMPVQLPDFDPVALGSSYYSVGTFFNAFPDDHMSVLIPLASNLNIRGYLAMHESMSVITSMREQILAIVHLICLILYGIVLLVFIYLILTILRPIRKITEGVREYAAGNLEHSIDVRSHDELGFLASSLNYMSAQLSKSAEYERSFIANVSHDFRSPLTSIKGYLEAIQDGTIPPEMQGKYLGIVLAETERLTKLTNGILTLNTMDEKKNLLHISRFDINSVLRDTAAAFEGACRERQISIELLLTGETLYVEADLGKIQQVLYNLIDNAVKFSKDNSKIELESDVRHDKVFISVKDHGCGIPSRSINKIWERFYKTDASRGRERKGNGLGLAIVREIINEHKQNITVISTEGVGTEFVFSLNQAEDM